MREKHLGMNPYLDELQLITANHLRRLPGTKNERSRTANDLKMLQVKVKETKLT